MICIILSEYDYKHNLNRYPLLVLNQMGIIFIGGLWLLIAMLIVLYIQSNIFNRKIGLKIGFILIALSFICGFVLLSIALYTGA